MRMSRSLSALAALLAFVASAPALAQTQVPAQTLPPPAQKIYKVRMPDGSVVFTDTVPRGAKILDERDASKPSQVTLPPPARATGTSRSAAPAAARQPSAIDKAAAEVEAAERALQDAKAELERGREPEE